MKDSAVDRSGDLVGGKYRLVRLLGRGGMGAVYEAENTWTGRRVATKLLRPEYARDREALRRFMQEAQSASQIAHPHIIDVLDLGLETSDGSLYMVQELLQGQDLRARLRSAKQLSPREALEVLVPILGALAAAHERGVIHRDIKPENIFLTPSGPKLIDFGIAKVLEPGQSGAQTGAGTALGTPRYMAPEQVRGEPDVDARADVWSVGVVLYELITGTNPFEAATAFGSANRVLQERPSPLQVSLPVAAVVERTLSPSKGERFADARALLHAILPLDEAQGFEDRFAAAIVRRPNETVAATAPVIYQLTSQIGTGPTLAAPDTQRGRGKWLAGAAVIAGLSVAGWWLLKAEPPAAGPPAAIARVETSPSPSPTAIEVAVPAAKRPYRLIRPVRPPPPKLEEGTNRAPIVE